MQMLHSLVDNCCGTSTEVWSPKMLRSLTTVITVQGPHFCTSTLLLLCDWSDYHIVFLPDIETILFAIQPLKAAEIISVKLPLTRCL